MTGYVIWGSILLFFVILMVSPIVLSVKLGEENVIFVRYLFVKIPLFPAKEKSEAQRQKAKEKKEAKKLAKQQKQEAKKEPESKEDEKAKAKMTVSEILELLGELAEASASPVFHLFRHIYLVKLDLKVAVGGEDAAQIAINTGRIEAAVGYFIGIFRSLKQLKKLRHAIIRPNFLSEKTEYRVSFCIMIKLGTILYAVFAAVLRFLFIKIRDMLRSEQPTKR